jgi:hypothetical protein
MVVIQKLNNETIQGSQGTRDVLARAGARQHQFIRPYCRPIADVTLDRLFDPGLALSAVVEPVGSFTAG